MHYALGTYPDSDDEYEPNSADEEAEREIERLASAGAVPDSLDAQLAQMEVNQEAIGILHTPPAVEHPLGSGPQPTTDLAAMELLFKVARDDWASQGKTLFVFNDGTWTHEESAFQALVIRHKDLLGPKYGESCIGISNIQKLAKTKNCKDAHWTLGFDHLAQGLVPFSDGIYDVATRELREIERGDMLTQKFDFAAPTRDEDFRNERAQVESMLDDLFPEEQLKREVMTRVAESLFNCTNTHKYFVQLYGEGNNGKTTLMRILQTAFPIWVKMPSVEHLVVHGVRDADRPQPWLMDVMGARILGFEEPPRGAKFDGSLLKLLRGNGIVTGRGLYQGNVSYVPTYTIWLACNSPVEIAPSDQAVLNSLHSFHMPSYFKDPEASAPLGTVHVKKKIPNLEARFKGRAYKLALFDVLSDYFADYRRTHSLPALESHFSKSMSDIYRDDHPSVHEIFERCVTVDRASSVGTKHLLHVLQGKGYEDSLKALTLFLEEKFRRHTFVKRKRQNTGMVWMGLHVDDDDGY